MFPRNKTIPLFSCVIRKSIEPNASLFIKVNQVLHFPARSHYEIQDICEPRTMWLVFLERMFLVYNHHSFQFYFPRILIIPLYMKIRYTYSLTKKPNDTQIHSIDDPECMYIADFRKLHCIRWALSSAGSVLILQKHQCPNSPSHPASITHRYEGTQCSTSYLIRYHTAQFH